MSRPRRYLAAAIALVLLLATGTSAAPQLASLAHRVYLPIVTRNEPLAVVKVVDGDAVDVRINGVVERLRLIGMDTPETVHPEEPVQCYGPEASARAHELLDGRQVTLEADPTQGDRDVYGRLLRYLWLPDGRHFNRLMIAEGYAHEYTYSTPYRYRDDFRAAQQYAQSNLLGLWSPATCNGNTDQPAPSPSPSPQPDPRSGCDPSYPTICLPPPPPDLDCGDIVYRNVTVLQPDPHRFDSGLDGIGCES